MCAETALWLKIIVFLGLIPDAKYAAVTSKVLLSNSFGSCLIVIACKSTMQNIHSKSFCRETQFLIANIIFAILVYYFKDFINIYSSYRFLNLSIFVLLGISFYVLLLNFFKIFIFSNFQLFKLR